MDVQVRQGDTLWLYSQLFRIPLNLLLDSNRNINPASLNIGQIVKIPGYRLQTYTIKAGDSLWRISQQRGLPLDSLLLVNPNVNPNNLQVGQRINLPSRVTTPVVRGQRVYDYAALQQDLEQLL